MKILISLVNFGETQLQHLKKVIDCYKSYEKYEVKIIVSSNIPVDCDADEVRIYTVQDFPSHHWDNLPCTCKIPIHEHKDDFDIFIFSENDHLILEKHIDNHLRYTDILPDNRISGLIQFEQDVNGNYFYPGYHWRYDWDYNSIEEHGGLKFAHFTNTHQASYVVTQAQLRAFEGNSNYFSHIYHSPPSKPRVNVDLYTNPIWKKLICISEFNDNLVRHLPDNYIRRISMRSDDLRMQEALNKLLNK